MKSLLLHGEHPFPNEMRPAIDERRQSRRENERSTRINQDFMKSPTAGEKVAVRCQGFTERSDKKVDFMRHAEFFRQAESPFPANTDDMGFVQIKKALYFFLVVTTNLPFDQWTEVLERLTHRCHILEASGESYRLKSLAFQASPMPPRLSFSSSRR